MELSHVQTIFFDYDGTLHNSLAIYKTAFLKVFDTLVKQGYMKMRHWEDDEISKFLGQSPKEMWDVFGKDLPIEIRRNSSQMIGELMDHQITIGKASLYDGTIETLNYLKNKGYKLIFISNCTNSYMQHHAKIFHLNQYFDLMVNAEMYDYIPKEDILAKIKNQFSEKMLIVGDRYHDIKAGKENNIYTIGCIYGYGTDKEISIADMRIHDITELKKIL